MSLAHKVGSAYRASGIHDSVLTAASQGPVAGARTQVRKGQAGGMIDKVLTIVIIPMLLLIGLIVFGNFESSVDTSTLSTEAQSAVNTTASNAYNGFDLAAVLPIVVAGVAVLSLVISAFVFDLGR